MKSLSQSQIFEGNFYTAARKQTRPKNTDLIRSVSTNQHEILGWIQNLYGIPRFDLDCTYNRGRFYRNGIQVPRFKTDIVPIDGDVIPACATALPFRSNSFKSIIFDPPFFAIGGKDANIKFKYGAFNSIDQLWATYQGAMLEAYRVLKPQGHLVFKCQDFICGRQQFLIHADIIKYAQSINLYPRDLFIKLATHVPIAWNHNNQNHARKFHCYFIVLQKKVRKVRELKPIEKQD